MRGNPVGQVQLIVGWGDMKIFKDMLVQGRVGMLAGMEQANRKLRPKHWPKHRVFNELRSGSNDTGQFFLHSGWAGEAFQKEQTPIIYKTFKNSVFQLGLSGNLR